MASPGKISWKDERRQFLKVVKKHHYPKPMADSLRARLIEALLRKYVIPCFEALTDQMAVIDIIKNGAYRFRMSSVDQIVRKLASGV